MEKKQKTIKSTIKCSTKIKLSQNNLNYSQSTENKQRYYVYKKKNKFTNERYIQNTNTLILGKLNKHSFVVSIFLWCRYFFSAQNIFFQLNFFFVKKFVEKKFNLYCIGGEPRIYENSIFPAYVPEKKTKKEPRVCTD